MLGAVLQRESDVISFADLRREWYDFVAEHYAPTLAARASRARRLDEAIRCQMYVGPLRELTVDVRFATYLASFLDQR